MSDDDDKPIEDREFTRAGLLRFSFGRLKKAAATGAGMALDRYADRLAPHVIRPPGAITEFEFLIACTRCGECSKACPANAILTLDHRAGAASGTPFLDPHKYRPCIACKDTPCITACDDEALMPLAIEDAAMGTAKIDRSTCKPWSDKGECTRCIGACPFPGDAILADEDGKPFIDPRHCIGCGLCVRACPTRPRSVKIKPSPRF